MKVLIDTNVILDVLLNRSDFFNDSREIFEFVEHKRIIGCISASSMTDIFYIINKQIGELDIIYSVMEKLLSLFSISSVTEVTINDALSLHWKDFEDALQYIVAKENNIEYIITRNNDDFKTSNIPCMSPADFIKYLKEIG